MKMPQRDYLEICALLLALALICLVPESKTTKMCTAIDKLDDTWEGIRLANKSFINQTVNSFMLCAELCFHHKMCESFNWNQHENLCELNYESFGQFSTKNRFIFTSITRWPIIIKEACTNHNCPINTRCEENSTEGFTCVVIGCSGVPQVSNANTTSFSVVKLWKFYEMVYYPCNKDFYPSRNVTCTPKGSWSNFTCVPLSSCTQIQTCNPYAEDDDYWLQSPNFDGRIVVYCMFFPTKVKVYITLYEHNTATKPIYRRDEDSCLLYHKDTYIDDPGYTDFQKVRLSSLTSPRLLINQHTFSNSTYEPQNYGNARDCINHGNDCGVIGEFIVDLGGTSFRVNSSTRWEQTGIHPRIESIDFSNNNTRVVGKCGGDCGGCRPQDNEISVERNPNFDPPDESASHTLCPHAIA